MIYFYIIVIISTNVPYHLKLDDFRIVTYNMFVLRLKMRSSSPVKTQS